MLQSSKSVVRRAMDLQEERKRARQRPLPLWVIPCIIFFGWNEVMALLRSPLLCIFCTFLFLFMYQLYQDLNVDEELEKGFPAAAITIGRRIVPVSRLIVSNTIDAMQRAFEVIRDGKPIEELFSGPTPFKTPAAAPPTPNGVSGVGNGFALPDIGQQPEIEMSPLMNSPVGGLQRRVHEDAPQTPVMRNPSRRRSRKHS
jgi:hypothetical protein